MKYKLQLNNYKELEISKDKIRKISHDINNHNIIIHNFILNKEYDKALSYLTNCSDAVQIYNDVYFTNNSVLNAILSNKSTICKINNINLSLSIKIPSKISLSDFDLCVIVGNLIDNAIEACIKIDCNRYIKVNASIINNNFSFKIINSYDGHLSINNGLFLTLKKDTFKHGLGISNVKSIVLKCNGFYDFNFSKDEFFVIITIPLI
ncbi:MAG: ATP-binding protein [Peptostreptococcaceae bacterium]